MTGRGVSIDARYPFRYEMNPTTWVYLSSLMIIGIYFKFHRFWSVRNLDLLGLIALSPGLLLVLHRLGARPASSGPAICGCSSSAGAFCAAAAGSLDGPPPAVGAEPLGQRPDLFRRGPDGLPGGQRLTARLTTSDVEGAKRMDRVLARQERRRACRGGVAGAGISPVSSLRQLLPRPFPPATRRRRKSTAAQIHHWLPAPWPSSPTWPWWWAWC